jgi:hypothetical protein
MRAAPCASFWSAWDYLAAEAERKAAGVFRRDKQVR